MICKLMFLALMLAWGVCGRAGRPRGEVCRSKEAKCIWLNEHLRRPGGFPVHSSVCPGCKADVYCYDSDFQWSKVVHVWDSLYITIVTEKPSNMAVFSGNSSKKSTTRAISASSVMHLNPFKTSCVGVVHAGGSDGTPYSVNARLKLWPGYPVLTAMGLLLLFRAPKLSRNVPLIYGAGITLGVLASALVILYVLSRYLPGRSFVGLGVLAGGYTAMVAVAYWAMDYATVLLLEHWEYVLGYVVVTGCLSFAVIYWWGGVNNPRTFDLIQWGCQMFALLMIFLATASMETSMVVVAMVLITYNVPIKWNPIMLPLYLCYRLLCLLVHWCRGKIGPPRAIPVRRLLTIEEYEEQGKRETAKALLKLQDYCRDHASEVLDTVKDTNRSKLGRFVKSGVHVSEEEQVNHDWALLEEEEGDSDSEVDTSQHSRATASSHSSSPTSHAPTPSQPHPSPLHRSSPTPSSIPRYSRDYLSTMYHTSPRSSKHFTRRKF